MPVVETYLAALAPAGDLVDFDEVGLEIQMARQGDKEEGEGKAVAGSRLESAGRRLGGRRAVGHAEAVVGIEKRVPQALEADHARLTAGDPPVDEGPHLGGRRERIDFFEGKTVSRARGSSFGKREEAREDRRERDCSRNARQGS